MSARDDQHRAEQRHHWDQVAPRWDAWKDEMAEATRPVSRCMLEMARVRPGQRVLDVATGLGEPALSAAEAVGPGGCVVAVDLSPQMLALAGKRMRERGVAVHLARMDGGRPAFRDGVFDAVLVRFGLMALPDLPESLARLLRVLAPGGTLAAAVWGPPEEVPLLSLPLRVAREALGLAPPAAGDQGPFRLADAEALAVRMTGAGFTGVCIRPVTVRYAFPSVEAFTAYTRQVASSVQALVASLAPERREAVWDEVSRLAGRLAAPDGSLAMSGQAICLAGQRPVPLSAPDTPFAD